MEVDDAPHPRILFEDVPESVYRELEPLAGTALKVHSSDQIHASDWDLLVTFGSDAGLRDSSLHVLSFGARHLDSVRDGDFGRSMRKGHQTYARGGYVAEGLPSELSDLARRTVVSQIPQGEKSTWVYGGYTTTDDLGGTCTPIVHIGQERYVYALHRKRDSEGQRPAICWALPEETIGHREWLSYVLDQLRANDPDRVPSDPSWQTSETWAPPALEAAMHQLADLEGEWETVCASFDERRRTFIDEIESQTRVASEGVWRLLTTQGNDLIAAVVSCLTDLGFTVRDMDGHHDMRTGAKLEDLRVTDTEDPSWECLVEVKGYTKGAKVNDITQITGRPSVHYAAEKGRPPSSVWHIVNTFLAMDPSSRPLAVPSDLDLRPLTDANGALIDTRDLFRAWRAVTTEAANAAGVRLSLRDALTRWTDSSSS